LDCHCCACVGGDIVGIVVVVENLSLLWKVERWLFVDGHVKWRMKGQRTL
jgi:hypothetical protein